MQRAHCPCPQRGLRRHCGPSLDGVREDLHAPSRIVLCVTFSLAPNGLLTSLTAAFCYTTLRTVILLPLFCPIILKELPAIVIYSFLFFFWDGLADLRSGRLEHLKQPELTDCRFSSHMFLDASRRYPPAPTFDLWSALGLSPGSHTRMIPRGIRRAKRK
ncbi:hypothetical protein DFH07DRAFT_829817 [Mycena maculata]|uniref:Uncharacterized protein n=1 Tax=Mycena maculata TaxID=230809 RepID=A0AAD7N6X1_9AGAR|nr:hypothetical protein DFH07DRAFT_829817 [Mycena maculata]